MPDDDAQRSGGSGRPAWRRHPAHAGLLAAVALVAAGVVAVAAHDEGGTVVTARGAPAPTSTTAAAAAGDRGDPSDQADPPPEADAAPDEPAPRQGEAPAADDGSPDPARCPNYVADPGDDEPPPGADHEALSREQDRLEADARAAMRYGEEHPDTYAGMKYANHPRVRVVVAFTGRLQEHCDALRARLQHPDEFELRSSPYTGRELSRIQDEISAYVQSRRTGLLRSSGRGFAPVVEVQLRADGEAVAAELVDRYGDVVDVRVGFHPYPPSRITGPAPSCGGPLGDEVAERPGVEATLALDPATIGRGGDTRGRLTIRNTGLEPFEFFAGAPSEVGAVVAPGTTTVVSRWDAGMAAAAQGGRLAPGESRAFDVIVGTAACDPADGYALAPGRYGVVTSFEVTWEWSGRTEQALSREATLHLTG